MKWTIEGAEVHSGRERIISVDAASQAEAEAIAKRRGMLIAAVHQSVADETGLGLNAPAEPPPVPTNKVVPLTLRPEVTSGIPQYGGLELSALVLRAIGILQYIAAVLMIVAALVSATESSRAAAERGIDVFGLGISGVATFVSGALCHGAGSACLALRDMAQNSFRAVPKQGGPTGGLGDFQNDRR
jgi:hypothetical protein